MCIVVSASQATPIEWCETHASPRSFRYSNFCLFASINPGAHADCRFILVQILPFEEEKV